MKITVRAKYNNGKLEPSEAVDIPEDKELSISFEQPTAPKQDEPKKSGVIIPYFIIGTLLFLVGVLLIVFVPSVREMWKDLHLLIRYTLIILFWVLVLLMEDLVERCRKGAKNWRLSGAILVFFIFLLLVVRELPIRDIWDDIVTFNEDTMSFLLFFTTACILALLFLRWLDYWHLKSLANYLILFGFLLTILFFLLDSTQSARSKLDAVNFAKEVGYSVSTSSASIPE